MPSTTSAGCLAMVSRFAIRNFLGESPKKWLGEGAEGLLSPRSNSLPKVLYTIRDPFCTGTTPSCSGAKHFSHPGLESKDLLHPLLTSFWNLPFSGSPRTFGLQDKIKIRPEDANPPRPKLREQFPEDFQEQSEEIQRFRES